MSDYFKPLEYFSTDYVKMIREDFEKMLNNGDIEWHEHHKQICINTHKDYREKKFSSVKPEYIGTGSLIYNWTDDGLYMDVEKRTSVEKYEERLSDHDFTEISPVFEGTVMEDFLKKLREKHHVGRLRFMKMLQRKCLSWHVDYTPRVHTVLNSSEGNFMVIEDEVKHMPEYTTWITDTTYHHTAFNASMHPRVHIVGVLLDGYNRRS